MSLMMGIVWNGFHRLFCRTGMLGVAIECWNGFQTAHPGHSGRDSRSVWGLRLTKPDKTGQSGQSRTPPRPCQAKDVQQPGGAFSPGAQISRASSGRHVSSVAVNQVRPRSSAPLEFMGLRGVLGHCGRTPQHPLGTGGAARDRDRHWLYACSTQPERGCVRQHPTPPLGDGSYTPRRFFRPRRPGGAIPAAQAVPDSILGRVCHFPFGPSGRYSLPLRSQHHHQSIISLMLSMKSKVGSRRAEGSQTWWRVLEGCAGRVSGKCADAQMLHQVIVCKWLAAGKLEGTHGATADHNL